MFPTSKIKSGYNWQVYRFLKVLSVKSVGLSEKKQESSQPGNLFKSLSNKLEKKFLIQKFVYKFVSWTFETKIQKFFMTENILKNLQKNR